MGALVETNDGRPPVRIGTFIATPIDLGPETDAVYLVLYGTGIRFRTGLAAVTASIGGANAGVLYAGGDTGLTGLDQINVLLPRSLAGRGEVDVVLTVDRELRLRKPVPKATRNS